MIFRIFGTPAISYHEAERADIEDLLLDKVSDALNENQRRRFIKDLLQEMRIEGAITTIGKTSSARWILTPSTPEKA